MDRYQEEFSDLLKQRGFEHEDHISLTIWPKSKKRKEEYLALYRLQWIQDLAKKRFYDVHQEVFEHFAKHAEHLKMLSWRQYEELLDSVFRNQGFETELGPGTNDGGVDIRLYQSQAFPQLVTLVQAKRYSRRPVSFESVAALFGVAIEQRASRGILATTSYFEPKARRFAWSTQQRLDIPTIELANGRRVGEWCAEIAEFLNEFFRTGKAPLPSTIARASTTGLSGKIVVARGGYNTTANDFAIVEADFPHEVILRRIGSKIVSGDLQVGREVPMDGAKLFLAFKNERFVAFKQQSEYSNEGYFWGDRQLFTLWDGTPQYFNHMD